MLYSEILSNMLNIKTNKQTMKNLGNDTQIAVYMYSNTGRESKQRNIHSKSTK